MKFSARILGESQFLPPAERLDAVAAAVDLSDAETELRLDFRQIGLITLVVKSPRRCCSPSSASTPTGGRSRIRSPSGMAFTLVGMVLLGFGPAFAAVLVAAALIGLGSAVFHPESSRIARLASGGRHGFAQALFQVGGNTGSALGPLIAAFFVCRTDSPASRGFRCWRCSDSFSSGMSAIGTSRRRLNRGRRSTVARCARRFRVGDALALAMLMS